MQYFKPKLFLGNVYHKRFYPKAHEFNYSSYFIKISLFNLDECKNIFFSINRFNLFSFNFKDHGLRNGSNLIDFARDQLKEANQDVDFDDVVIHTYPRILGFVFNPVSFWYFYKNGKIYARMAEVNNTFGETKCYVINEHQISYEKKMQVSPFNLIEGHYCFRFSQKDNSEKVEIKYYKKNELIVYASIDGIEKEFNQLNFFSLFLKNPFLNLAAVFFIHYEALRLYIKKIPFHGKNGVIHDKQ